MFELNLSYLRTNTLTAHSDIDSSDRLTRKETTNEQQLQS